jgi:hypothetical protein
MKKERSMRKSGVSRRSFLMSGAGLALGAAAGGCRTAGSGGAGKRIAVFTCDVTPPLGTPIYSSYKPLEKIETPLLAKGIILEQGGRRFVLCAVDYCELCNESHTLFRQKLADAAGTDIDYVAVQTVHQHTAPMADISANRLLEGLPHPPAFPATSSITGAADCLAAAAAKAAGTLTPFNQVGTGQGKVECVASNRRVRLEDGSIGVRYSSCKDPTLTEAPEGLIDPFVKTITFAQDGKPLAHLHYYATHPQSFYGDPRASWDFAGMARQALEEREGVFQAYFTGCSGDITAGKYNPGTPESRQGLCDRLLKGMEASVATTQYEKAGDIGWATLPLLLKTREDKGFTAAECRAEMENEQGSVLARNGAAMGLAWHERAGEPVVLSALHLGGVSVLNIPGEAMIAFQLFAQQAAAARFVAVAAYGDCAMGYICLKSAFAEGGYEPTATNVVPESEDALKAAISALLAAAPQGV